MTFEVIDGVRTIVTGDFAASPDVLYDAFTEPALAARWMWGAGAPNVVAEMDVRVGGRYRISRDAPPNDDSGWPSDTWAIAGVFVEIDPMRKLVYTLHWAGPVGYNQDGSEVLDEAAIVTFDPLDGGTRVTYQHIGIPDDGISAHEHGKAVDATFADLATLIDG